MRIIWKLFLKYLLQLDDQQYMYRYIEMYINQSINESMLSFSNLIVSHFIQN